jgi:hypothetical protein
MTPTSRWRVFVLDEGAYTDEPCLAVVVDDDEQWRLLVADIRPGTTPDDILGEHGWRRTGDWEPGDEGRHAPVRRAVRGRMVRGVRVETKLAPDVLAQVESLIGTDGADRSEVIASLVRRGLAARQADNPIPARRLDPK